MSRLNYLLQNTSLSRQEIPNFSTCLLDTLPVWLTFGYLWMVALPYLVFLFRTRRQGLQFSYLHVLKTVRLSHLYLAYGTLMHVYVCMVANRAACLFCLVSQLFEKKIVSIKVFKLFKYNSTLFELNANSATILCNVKDYRFSQKRTLSLKGGPPYDTYKQLISNN